MKKTYLLLAVLAVVIFYLFKRSGTTAANPLAFPVTPQGPLPGGGWLGQPVTNPATTPLPTYNAVPQGPLPGGGWIGAPAPDAVGILDYQAPTLGDSAPAAAIAPDFSIGEGFFSAGSNTSSVFLA